MHKLASVQPRTMRLIVLGVGTVGIIANTLASFFMHGLHGDMVAQQVMVEQWTHGLTPLAATTEATNYIIKFPFYLLMTVAVPDPVARLLLVAMVLNVIAWLLIWYFIRKIMVLVGPLAKRSDIFLSICMLLLAILSPFLFWIDYPNSRNVELGLMVGLLYVLLKLQQNKQTRMVTTVLLGLAAGVVYANDPLSLYLVSIPFACAMIIVTIIRRDWPRFKSYKYLAVFLASSIATYLLLKTYVLGLLIRVPDKVSGIVLPNGEGAVHSAVNIFQGLAQNAGLIPSFKLGESVSANLFVVCMGLVNVALLFVLVASLKRPKDVARKRTQVTVLLVALVALVVVFASGYLSSYVDLLFARYVSIVSILLLLAALLGFMNSGKARQEYVMVFVLVCSVIAGLLLVRMQAPNLIRVVHAEQFWHEKNQREYTLMSIAKEYDIRKGYASLQVAQPTTYLSRGELTMIPLMCDKADPNHPVQRVDEWLIEARSAFMPTGNSMIEVPAEPSDFNPCSRDVVVHQIRNTPLAIIEGDGDHVVLVYDHDIRPQLYGVPQSFYEHRP